MSRRPHPRRLVSGGVHVENALRAEVLCARSYPAAPASVRAARRHAVQAVRGCGLGEAADTVALLVSELATNAITAAGSLHPDGDVGRRGQVVAVRLTRAAACLVVEVWDGDTTPPAPAARDDPDAEGGRGLHLVAALSRQWGHVIRPAGGGKVVWCALEAGAPAGAADGAAALQPLLDALRAQDGWHPPGPAAPQPGAAADGTPGRPPAPTAHAQHPPPDRGAAATTARTRR